MKSYFMQDTQLKSFLTIIFNKMLSPYNLRLNNTSLLYVLDTDVKKSVLFISTDIRTTLSLIDMEDLHFYYTGGIKEKITNISLYESIVYSTKFNKNLFKIGDIAELKRLNTDSAVCEAYKDLLIYLRGKTAKTQPNSTYIKNYIYPKNRDLQIKILERYFGLKELDSSYRQLIRNNTRKATIAGILGPALHTSMNKYYLNTVAVKEWIPVLHTYPLTTIIDMIKEFEKYMVETGYESYEEYLRNSSATDIRLDFCYFVAYVKKIA